MANDSFTFPSHSFHSADEHLRYYIEETVVPEVVLSNARFAYASMRRKEIDSALAAAKLDLDERILTGETRALELKAWYENGAEGLRAYNDWLSDVEVEASLKAPTEINPNAVEKIVRAAQAYHRSGGMPEEELAKVDSYSLTFGRDGNPSTIAEIVETFRTKDWFDSALTMSDLQAASKSDRIIELLQIQVENANARERDAVEQAHAEDLDAQIRLASYGD